MARYARPCIRIRCERYGELSEFMFDLRHPNKAFDESAAPLLERDPLLFWKCLSGALLTAVAILAALLLVRP